MGFFDEENSPVETAWFSVMAAISLACFPFGVRLGRRFPQILVTKLVPIICLLLAYENIVLALSNALSNDSTFVLIGRTTRAAVIPLFLVVMFEVAYAVHKRRSVKFCGIVFDQGHRRSVEPCSWFLRNFVRIVAVMIFVVGILVNYDIIVGNDEKAGGTGLVDAHDASTHLLLALLPTTGMAMIALYIAAYMWKYGNDASIVVQTTVCNGWMFLFLGTLALLAGQVPPDWCFRVVNETGQLLLLLSLIAIGREIGKEVQAADDFSSFLEKENELESGSGAHSQSTVTPAADKPIGPSQAELKVEPNGNAVTCIGMADDDDGIEKVAVDQHRTGGDSPAVCEDVLGLDDDQDFEDVTRPMGRPAKRSTGSGGGGQVRSRASLFNKKGVSLLGDREEGFPGLSENEEERIGVGRDILPSEAGTGQVAVSSSSSLAAPGHVVVEGNRSGATRSGVRGNLADVV